MSYNNKWKSWNFDQARTARRAQQAQQEELARILNQKNVEAEERALIVRYDLKMKKELAKLFAKWARKYHVPGDHIFDGSMTRKWLLASEYGASGGETHRFPNETWITWTGKLFDGNGFTIEEFESCVQAKIVQYDYPWPP
jgi:hypothetical protein